MNLIQLRPLVIAVAIMLAGHSAHPASLDDIQFWAGSGDNRAALVIDWNDGKSQESLLWGYRWNGSATGLDMLQAVVSADSRLYAYLADFSFGRSILGIGYDLNDSGGFAVNPALTFNQFGIALDSGSGNANDSRAAADSGDHYVEGWNSGYWAYYLKSGATEPWGSAPTGASGRPLTDGAWDGYSFALGFSGAAPGESVAAVVPEPGAIPLLVLGLLMSGFRLRLARK